MSCTLYIGGRPNWVDCLTDASGLTHAVVFTGEIGSYTGVTIHITPDEVLKESIVSLPREQFMASMPKIDSPTRQLIPFAPTVLRPPRLRMALAFGLATLRHGYHSDSTATIPAAASSSSLATAHNYESADGVAYRGLTALASLSLAVSDRMEDEMRRLMRSKRPMDKLRVQQLQRKMQKG